MGDYSLITSGIKEDLVNKVSDAMQLNWKPQGGIAMAVDDDGFFFAQAMVLEDV